MVLRRMRASTVQLAVRSSNDAGNWMPSPTVRAVRANPFALMTHPLVLMTVSRPRRTASSTPPPRRFVEEPQPDEPLGQRMPLSNLRRPERRLDAGVAVPGESAAPHY